MNKVAIIGSGLGGLLTGYVLSKEGFEVLVLEKNKKFGGCLQSFRRGTFSFDTGMHYLGSLFPGQILYNYWKYFGISSHLDLLQMDPDGFDRISFGDQVSISGERDFPLAQGFENFREQLLSCFPASAQALDHYTQKLNEIAHSHPLYNLELPLKGWSDPYQSVNAYKFLQSLSPHSLQRGGGNKVTLSSILAGNNFLYAGDPSTTSLSLFALINHSFISSAYRVKGGSQQIADILVEGIRTHGGQVLAKKKVISVTRPGKVFYILTADEDQFEAPRIISDIHPATMLQLLDNVRIPKAYRDRINSLSNTVSVFSVYLGLKSGMFPFLNHNVYHHRSSQVWTGPGSTGNHWPESYLFMTPPSTHQGVHATSAVILTTMHFHEVKSWELSHSGTRDKSYFIFKAKRAIKLLGIVFDKFPLLKEAIETIDISTPLTWRDYTGTPQGSLYGIIKDATNTERTTILPKTKIPNLYFTGQNTNLHGALGVTIGSIMTCGEILGLPYVMTRIKREI